MLENYNDTMEWLNLIQTSAPESEIRLLLTKVDILNEEERKSKTEKFCKGFGELVDRAIELTKGHLEESTVHNRALHEKHLKNFAHVKQQLDPAKIPCVSCVNGWEGSVTRVSDFLLKYADKQKHVVMLRPIDQELFLQIGKLGIRDHMILEEEIAVDKNVEAQLDVNLSESAAAKLTGAEDFDTNQSNEKKLTSDERSADPTEILRQQYVTFEEVQKVFRPILKQYYPDREPELEEELRKSLLNLKKRGLLQYFTGNKKLEGIIFNDISTMVNILRCIFHHSMDEFLKFRNLDGELRKKLYGNHKFKYDKDVDCLRKHGIMSSSLIKVLLKKCGCSIDSEVVVHLLHHLNVAFIIPNEPAAGNYGDRVFIPFFLEGVEADENFEVKKKEMSRCHNRVLSVNTVLKADLGIPRTFFHQLVVKLLGKISEMHTTQKNNKAWKDGVSASLGEHEAKVMMLYTPEQTIEFIIQANVENPDAHRLMWEHIMFLHCGLYDLRDSKFPGLPLEYYLICTDCSIQGHDSTAVDTWDIDGILYEPSQRSTLECAKLSKGFPCALITPLPEGSL